MKSYIRLNNNLYNFSLNSNLEYYHKFIGRTAYQNTTNNIYVRPTPHDAWCGGIIVCFDGLVSIRYKCPPSGTIEVIHTGTVSTSTFKIIEINQTTREICFNTGSWYYMPLFVFSGGIDAIYTL